MVYASIGPEDAITRHALWTGTLVFGCSAVFRGTDPTRTLEVLLRREGEGSSTLLVSPISDEEGVRCHRGGGCEREEVRPRGCSMSGRMRLGIVEVYEDYVCVRHQLTELVSVVYL